MKFTSEFKLMNETVENSAWHREKNVGVHTDMVVSQYLTLAGSGSGIWSKVDVLGALACAFHDFGKPAAEEEKYSEERGVYRRYVGHEIKSSRIWEGLAIEYFDSLTELFDLDVDDIYRVAWVIEHHLPYGTKKPNKVKALRATVDQTVGIDVFVNCLMADCLGRMSDDHDTKIENALQWCTEFRTVECDYNYPDGDAPTMSILIGPSGSGKSTFRSKLTEQNAATEVISLDDYRTMWYQNEKTGTPEGYSLSWNAANEDKEFNAKVQVEFNRMLNAKSDIIVDNVNTTAKSRRKWIDAAMRKGYRVHCVLFPNVLQTIISRQHTRDDKTVPENAVREQYARVQMPSYLSECHRVQSFRTF